jgi:hypothetical protein
MGLAPEERAKPVLEGIYRTCALSFMDAVRLSCPDVTVNCLCSRNGEVYLDMLNMFFRAYYSGPVNDIVFIPHAIIDWWCNPTEEEVRVGIVGEMGRIKTMRTIFLTQTLQYILGLRTPQIPFIVVHLR